MTPDQERDQLKSAAIGMAALRVWCGAFLLLVGVLKLPALGGEWGFPQRLARWLEVSAGGGAHPQVAALVKPLAKHAAAVAGAVGFAEVALGALLVVGLFTRFASFTTMAMAALYWAVTARMGVATVGASLTMAVTAACLFIGNAGLYYGIDGWRARRKDSTV